MKNIQLSLKRKWFYMTKDRIKKEDYREITTYWYNRLIRNEIRKDRSFKNFLSLIDCMEPLSKQTIFKHFDTNTMTLGYPKLGDTDRIIKYKHLGIEIRNGNPDWGAVPGKLYFVIKHGDPIT